MQYLVIDADSMVYAAAHSVEKNYYAVIGARGDHAADYGADLSYADAKDFISKYGGGTLYKRTEIGSKDSAIDCLRGILSQVQGDVERHLGTRRVKIRVLLTGYGNFRERLASMIRYKFNRVETKKPHHYGTLRKYLVDEVGAELIHWYEADDECAIEQTLHPACIVSSIDKDLLQVPGLHYIPNKGFMSVSEKSGILRFYTQALMGDSTDGIPGCYRIGETKAKATAFEVAAECESKGEGLAMLERRLWARVTLAYHTSLAKYGPDKCGYEDAAAAALETARLVYLLRERPSDPANPTLWEPPA